MFIQGEHDRGNIVGLNHQTGEPMDPQMEGIFDNYCVKRQIINSGYVKTFYLCFIFISIFPTLYLATIGVIFPFSPISSVKYFTLYRDACLA